MSRLPSEVRDWLEAILVSLVKWDKDRSPWTYVTSGWPREHNAARWQMVVDIIYRLLVSDLLRSDSYPSPTDWLFWPADSAEPPPDHFSRTFVEELAKVDPFHRPLAELDGLSVWIGPHLYATDKGRGLLQRHGVEEYGQVPEAFFDELEAIFESNQVPWSELPLIPVQASGEEGPGAQLVASEH